MYIPQMVKIETHSVFRVCFKERALDRARKGRNSSRGLCMLSIDSDAVVDLFCRYADSPTASPVSMMPYFDSPLPYNLQGYWIENERFKMLMMALVVALTPLWGLSTLAIGVEWLKYREIKKFKGMLVTEMYHDEVFFNEMLDNGVVTAYSNKMFYTDGTDTIADKNS